MVGIVILARLGSTRLTSKHLIEVNGKSFLEWCILRIKHQFQQEIENKQVEVIIATSDLKINENFLQFEDKLNIKVFFGHDSNIPLRLYQCADSFDLNSLIIVDGDDILCSTKAMRQVYSFVKSNSESYVGTTGLPLGMNVTGFSKSILSKYLKRYSDVNVLETGWGIAFNEEIKEKIEFPQQDIYQDIRITLDYQLDADFFSSVIDFFGTKIIDVSDIDMINAIIENKFNEINISLNEEYWANFNSQQSKLI